MIDLDVLAETRAKKLSQDQTAWRRAVWTPEFQKLSQNLSDGEIELFFDSCRTVLHFEIMTKNMMETTQASGISFGEMLEKVARSGYEFIDWVDAAVEIRHYLDERNLAVSFFEILMFINSCSIKSSAAAEPLLAAVQAELASGKLGVK